MWNGAGDKAEAFDCPAWFAGQRDHERAVNNGRQTARENCIRRNFHRFRSHDLAEAGNFQPHDFANRFRRDVPVSDAGSTGRED